MNKVYGLLGYPIQHSLSPLIFTKIFDREQLAHYEYRLFAYKEIETFMQLLHSIPHIAGFNVTSPHKQLILNYLSSLSPLAEKLQSVNVVKVIRDKHGSLKLKGYNSDAEGFLSLYKKLQAEQDLVKGSKALVCGTGGAASAVIHVLQDIGIETICATRDEKKPFHMPVERLSYKALKKKDLSEYQLIVQATPLGMSDALGQAPDLHYEEIVPRTCCIDLVYSPGDTLFLQKCRQRGAIGSNGLPMLYGQAEKAWEIWSKDNDSE